MMRNDSILVPCSENSVLSLCNALCKGNGALWAKGVPSLDFKNLSLID